MVVDQSPKRSGGGSRPYVTYESIIASEASAERPVRRQSRSCTWWLLNPGLFLWKRICHVGRCATIRDLHIIFDYEW